MMLKKLKEFKGLKMKSLRELKKFKGLKKNMIYAVRLF